MDAGSLRGAALALRAHGDLRTPDGGPYTTDALATDAARTAYMEAGVEALCRALVLSGALELEDGETVGGVAWVEMYGALAALMEELAEALGKESE